MPQGEEMLTDETKKLCHEGEREIFSVRRRNNTLQRKKRTKKDASRKREAAP
jgi:hypothetical protein